MTAQFAHDFRDGVDVNLGVGYVNEDTIPAALLSEAMHAVAADQATYRQPFNYGGAEGSPTLIASLRRFLGGRPGGLDEETLRRKRLIVGPCGATSILDGLAAVLPPGIVVTSDPTYYAYADPLERMGFELLAVPEDQDGPSLESLERKLRGLGDRVREISFFYVVTVNNPSGTILSNERRRALYGVAAQLSRELGRNVPVFFDLAYELLRHDPSIPPFESVLGSDSLGIAYEIGTLSKVLAPALRLGYLLGPDGPFMDAMVQKTSDTGFSAPLFVQEMGSYLLDRYAEDRIVAVNAGYREKAVAMKAAIDRELGPYLAECRGGQAGFYFYLTFRDIETHPDSPFFRYLTRTTGDAAVDGAAGKLGPRVIYIPGVYCVDARGDLAEAGRRQLRLSYGYEDADRLVDAIGVMRSAAEWARAQAAAETLPVG